jgi:RNA polymerase sigma-70 factor (family 1)
MEARGKQSEQYWIEAFRNGDDGSLSYFFKLHHKSLCYFAGRLIQNQLEAEDIVADCFVKLWERHQDFRTAGNIKAFLYISCRNACLNHLKQLKTRSASQQEYFAQLQNGDETILIQLIETEVLSILNEEIEHLPENYKDVFKLIYFDQKKTDEIADQLGLSVQTVRNYKSRAIDLLKTSMFKKGMSAAEILAVLMFIGNR